MGKDLGRTIVQLPSQSGVSYGVKVGCSRFHPHSRGGDAITSLGKLIHCLVFLQGKKFSLFTLFLKYEPLLVQFLPIVS